jgi:hypothetical protein
LYTKEGANSDGYEGEDDAEISMISIVEDDEEGVERGAISMFSIVNFIQTQNNGESNKSFVTF